MKVLHFSASITGGAGIAAVRYHQLCQAMGYDSILYYGTGDISHDKSIVHVGAASSQHSKQNIKQFIKSHLHKHTAGRSLLNWYHAQKSSHPTTPQNEYCFYNFSECESNGLRPDLVNNIDLQNVDVIFVHWLGGFLNTYDIKRLYERTHARIVFSMMDMEPITGGCHYFWHCKGYLDNCFDCPALDYSMRSLAHRQLQARAQNIEYMHPDIFSSSLYDLKAAKNGIVDFAHYWQCYYPIDETIFLPSGPHSGAKYIFSNSNEITNSRKGFWLVMQVLMILDRELDEDVFFLCLDDSPFHAYKFAHIKFEKFPFCKNVNDLAKIYQKADLFLCSSVEDAAPMMLAEALLCGVPTVAFDCATAKQFIHDGREGYVVPRYDVRAMAAKALDILRGTNDIDTPETRHNKMAKLYGIDAVIRQLKNIVENTKA